MRTGIYLYNGKLNISKNLDSSLKRRKTAIIIEEYNGDLEGEALMNVLQKMLNKHLKITKEKHIKKRYVEPLLNYHWKHKTLNKTLHSIYPTLNNIPNIINDEWESYIE